MTQNKDPIVKEIEKLEKIDRTQQEELERQNAIDKFHEQELKRQHEVDVKLEKETKIQQKEIKLVQNELVKLEKKFDGKTIHTKSLFWKRLKVSAYLLCMLLQLAAVALAVAALCVPGMGGTFALISAMLTALGWSFIIPFFF